MNEVQQRGIRSATRAGIRGICALLLGFLAPYSGQQDGKSFFQVARESTWDNPGDWPAAWCSLKIILVLLGIAMLIDSAARLAIIYRREASIRVFSWLQFVTGLVLLLGIYYLAKAVF